MNLSKKKKDEHPEKIYLKFYFDLLHYLGTGECWYNERPPKSPTLDVLYKMWCFVSYAYIIGGFFNEYIAFFTDLTDEEFYALLHHCLGHSCIFSKIIVLFFQKQKIKALFKRFFEFNREFTSLKLDQESVKRARVFCYILIFTVYLCVAMGLVSAVAAYFQNGTPIRTIITLYPFKDTPPLQYNTFRILIEIHWYYVCTVMNIIDCISVCALVFLSYKYKYLQFYYESLRGKYLQLVSENSRDVLEKEYEKEFVIGIKLHRDAIWCARNVQCTLGPLYSIQIVEGLVLVCACLLKMVHAGGDLAYFWANCSYMIAIITLTAAYMIPGGDVTNEAARLPLSIFYGGWDAVLARQRLRTLVVVTILNSQVPVIMTAFGIIELSYTNLIMVLRHSYSFFAVMYKH